MLDILISVHFLISLYIEDSLTLSKEIKQTVCTLDGYLTAYSLVTIVAYNVCLAHCFLDMIRDFQHEKKYTSGVKYHLAANATGVVFCLLSAIHNDIGLGVMGTCAIKQGTIVE